MDLVILSTLILQLLQSDSVFGVYLCSSGPTSWSEGISRCLTENGRPLSSKEVDGISLASTYQVWTSDFFQVDMISLNGPNELCRFVYRYRDGNPSSSGVFFCNCAESRKYPCRDSNSQMVVILNGNWTTASKCTFLQSELQNVAWTEGYYWTTDAKYKGKLGQVTNWTTFFTTGSGFYCGMYEDGVLSYLSDCGYQSDSLCYFETLPKNYSSNSCSNLATTATTTNSSKIPQTVIPTTSSFGYPVSRHEKTLMSPITEMSQVVEGSSSTSFTGTTAKENAHEDNPKETEHSATTATTMRPSTNSSKIPQTVPTTSSFGYPVSRQQETLMSPITEMSQVVEGSSSTSSTGTTAMENAHEENPKETKHTDIATTAGAGVGLSLALLVTIVSLIVIQRRYGCIRCRKRLKARPVTGDKSVRANPAYSVTDDLHIAHSNTKTKSPSLTERSKYENVISAKTKEPQDMLRFAQNAEYSFALNEDGPGKTENKDMLSCAQNTEFALDMDGSGKTENKDMLSCAQNTEYRFALDVDGPGITENKENVYNKTNGECIRKKVYNKTDTADFGENVYNKTFGWNLQQVQVSLTNEYGTN